MAVNNAAGCRMASRDEIGENTSPYQLDQKEQNPQLSSSSAIINQDHRSQILHKKSKSIFSIQNMKKP